MTRKPTMCHIIHSCSMHVLFRGSHLSMRRRHNIYMFLVWRGIFLMYLYTLMYHFRFKCTQRITEALQTSQIADESLQDMLQETP